MCIIVSANINNNHYLAKNRDRAYKPTISIIHTLVNDVEIAFLYDYETGWAEGMNEFGIGIVNSALSVGFDEIEKKIVKKKGTKSKDGIKIIKALTYNNIQDSIYSLKTFKTGVKGHTFISDKTNRYLIESTSKHNPISKKIKTKNEYLIRTNHGIIYQNAGYQQGNNYKSSIIRKISTEKILMQIDKPEDILTGMRKKFYSFSSNLNMNRDSKLSTTSQMLLGCNDLTFKLVILKNDINEFKGIINKLPLNYIPKIKINFTLI